MDFSRLADFIDSIPGLGVPGCECVVQIEGKQVFRHGAGYADRERGMPYSPGTLVNLYSATKPITCATALTLYERGKFLLGDPLHAYIPEFKDMRVRHWNDDCSEAPSRPAKNPITIRDLFSMTAGFHYDFSLDPIPQIAKETSGRFPTREIARAASQMELMHEPGTRWMYSMAHDVLGALVEVVSGKKFGDYMREAVLEPLHMGDTSFSYPADADTRMAQQYRYDDSAKRAEIVGRTANQYRLGTEYESGGAGLVSSLDDYAKFVAAMANGGTAPSDGARVLSRSTVDLWRSNALSPDALKCLNWEQLRGYGYGLGVRTMMDPAVAGSNGSVGEFGWGGAAGCYLMIDPGKNLSAFYIQHMLNNFEPYIHPRLRNAIYASL